MVLLVHGWQKISPFAQILLAPPSSSGQGPNNGQGSKECVNWLKKISKLNNKGLSFPKTKEAKGKITKNECVCA